MSFLSEIKKRGLENKPIKEETVEGFNLNSFMKKSSKIKKENDLSKKLSKLDKKTKKQIKKEIINNLNENILNLVKEPYENSRITKTDINKIFLNVKKELNIVKKRVKNKELKKDKVEKSKSIEHDEIQRIMAVATKKGLMEEVIATLFFKLGLKLFEITQLKIEDIDFNNGKIRLGDKIFEMDSGTAAKILAYIGSRTSGVLIKDGRKELSKDDLLNFIKNIMSAANVNKKEDIESLVEKFQHSLRKQGKPFMYWEYIDQVVDIRTKSIKNK